jgi:hypothetical protein
MRLENSGGDVLARGGSRAQFQGPRVSQEKWDAIWGDEPMAEDKQKENDAQKESN